MSRDLRRTDLGAIHAGKRALGLDDGPYRELLEQVTGKRSAADLTPIERGMVLDTMRQLGFGRTGRSAAFTPRERPLATKQVGKAHALWRELEALGQLRDSTDAALHAFGERQTGKSRLDWRTPQELNRVIEALKGWLGRARARARSQKD